jgi:hypothetical protein
LESREFRLSAPGKGLGISCDENGAFLGSIPLLERSHAHGTNPWEPIDSSELSSQVSTQFGLPIDMSAKLGGLKAIAGALNAGDLARAQIATVLLGIPDPPQLSKGAATRQRMMQLIRDLHWSGMLKWDPDEHPRWPAGQSDGGQFRPVNDDAESQASAAGGRAHSERNSDSSDQSSDSIWSTVASIAAAGAVEVAGNVAIGAEEVATGGAATPAVPAEEAGLAALAGEAGSAAAGAIESSGAKALEAAAESVWRLNPIQRGIAIEQRLAATEYADWYWVGQERNGFFPLIDFQQGDTLLSLRSVETTGVSWFGRIASHIEELGGSEATVNDTLAKMELDLRVQSGGFVDAKPLIQWGLKNNVIVRIKEFL